MHVLSAASSKVFFLSVVLHQMMVTASLLSGQFCGRREAVENVVCCYGRDLSGRVVAGVFLSGAVPVLSPAQPLLRRRFPSAEHHPLLRHASCHRLRELGLSRPWEEEKDVCVVLLLRDL